LKEDGVLLDCTLNSGGHSEEASKRLGGKLKIVGIDLDSQALKKAAENLAKCNANFILKEASFRDLDKVLSELNIQKVDAIIFDLGLSSNQLEESGRGFTFQKNEPLLMTFKQNPEESDLTAKDIVNNWDKENIEQILLSYGEERFAKRIAEKIVEKREEKPIETTFELVEIVRSAMPKSLQRGKINPATKTFQALRITVNDEIRALKEGLEKGFNHLNKEGRMAVISFHSLEDRIVKIYFKELDKSGVGKNIVKKPIVPNRAEILENPRSRSAKLRIIERII
jgi:16S rRNA (cytosine1402-N4)-methyltransferase